MAQARGTAGSQRGALARHPSCPPAAGSPKSPAGGDTKMAALVPADDTLQAMLPGRPATDADVPPHHGPARLYR
eukprot:4607937-Lingulodinium_polyedra.AAC.1